MKYRTEGNNQGITVLALPKSMASAATRPAGLNTVQHPAVSSFATEGENRPSTKDVHDHIIFGLGLQATTNALKDVQRGGSSSEQPPSSTPKPASKSV